MPRIIKPVPITLANVTCSPRNKTEHIIVINGELDIITVTNETAPLFIAAKYAKSPISVAKTASAASSSNVGEEILFNLKILPSMNIQPVMTMIVNAVLIAKPDSGFMSFNPNFTNKGAIPQHIIPINAKSITIGLPLPGNLDM